ncbi:DUF4178 domain-containing protein [Rhodoferax sp.]|uniref:DUF4178 domain-containing protein n=1 Tax=Rhodoferax sp. TaxID=50421 RepID=UPI0025D21EA7|nr:DUF4178 domain-containing protein [Rhodoferax sp.]
MATPSPQRAYRAPCPGCGAPVDFLSAQSTHAVCAYCQSTVVRSGETLARIGKMAELFDDHSPLQLQASGTWKAQVFTLVGRLQYKYAEGTWTEWHAVRADGSSAFLSEDNGSYVFTTPLLAERAVPMAEQFRVGATTAINGKTFSVASNQTVSLTSAQGELPHLPALGEPFAMVELRSAAGEVLSVDYGTRPPSLSIGTAVLLEDLQLVGLRAESVKDEKGRQFDCPSCGAPVTVQLASSKSITCGSCHSLIDLTSGIGGELRHATQDEPVQPLIPLGQTGKLQGVNWQVVGFQHRMGSVPGDDEQFGWEEYLLFNAKHGFLFLVDSTEGWSLVKPATGAPEMTGNGQSATYLGSRYQLKESYSAETSYVLGEFYWQVQRGQKTSNRDFTSGKSLLSMEQSAQEVTWSVGSQIDSALVATAFKLEGKKDLLQRSDASPLGIGIAGIAPKTVLWIIVVVVLLVIVFSARNDCDTNVENCRSSTRTSGGSYGGFSSGGGHK